MSIDRISIKAEARERMRSAVPRPYYEGLLFVLVSGILLALSYRVLSAKITPESSQKYLSMMLAGNYDGALRYAETLRPSSLDSFVSMVLETFRGLMGVGLSIFAVNTLRRQEASLWNLMDCFSRFFPFLLLVILRSFLVTLWLQLLIIPGILAAYRYRMAAYLMIDHPEISALPSILLSGRMMRGKKWSLFLLDLSFIGWFLLAMLPLTVCSAFGGWVSLIAGALGSAAILAWVLPYYELCCFGFYEAVKDSLPPIPPEI